MKEAEVNVPDIVFESVTFSYNDKVLDDLSLEINRGEFVAIVGANGSGKTTFARHINALLQPQLGMVLTVGLDTRDPDNLFTIRSHAGMVFQNPNTQMVASVVADDVAFGPENLNVQPPALQQRVKQALDTVAMSSHAEDDPAELSGGQRQRVSIAGILAMQPDILVLDEPGAMLDVRGRRGIRRIISELNQTGMTIVLITHFMEEAALAGRVIVLDQGKVALDGPPAEVFSEANVLRQLGLDLPFSSLLAEALSAQGFAIPESISLDDLKELICSWFSMQ
ncbi:MAG: energy-coupling factor transporter ATPase [Coriobacteriales bacterium]|jgi:energy-coupling factor transport system ATP-binding protein|nr:energy-coupling factor transporter ATPase [Coriobacteriales bacterium]